MSLQITPVSERLAVVADTNALQTQMTTLQEEEASNLAYTAPDQAPATIVASMTVTSGLDAEQWDQTNLTTANEVLTTVNGALEQMTQLLNSAEALAVQASNATTQIPDEMTALVATAEHYVTEYAGLLNTQAQGVYVFAAADPFQPVVVGSSLVNQPAPGSTAWVWQLPVQPGVSVAITANGYEPGIAPGSTSVFVTAWNALNHLVSALQQGAPSTAEGALQQAASELNSLTAYMGAQQTNVHTFANQASTAILAAQEHLSALDSVNLPAVLSQQAADQTAYEAALQATGALLQLSLWHYVS